MLDEYYNKELLPLYGDLTEGAQIEYGYVSESNGQFSYGEPNVTDGIIARAIGNFHISDRERADRDMAVFFLRRRPMETRDTDKTVLEVEFSTVSDGMEIKELGHAVLKSNLFWNDSLRCRVFSNMSEGKFSIGCYSHRVNRFWDKPDELSLNLFTFDGDKVSVAFSDRTSINLSSSGKDVPSAHDFPETEPFIKAFEEYGFAETAKKWICDFSNPDVSGSDIRRHALISTYPKMNGLYENLLRTPKGEKVCDNCVRGFIQPDM